MSTALWSRLLLAVVAVALSAHSVWGAEGAAIAVGVTLVVAVVDAAVRRRLRQQASVNSQPRTTRD